LNVDRQPIVILVADDDEEDRMLTREALEFGHLANDLRFVKNGDEVMDYLHHRGKFVDEWSSPRPGLILLDLNMPRKDGRECLAEIKSAPAFRDIPVFVLTTSRAEEDIHRTYELGSSSFLSKPVTFETLIEKIITLTRYRIEIVDG
jgi:CheY-like chemotaxis protein